MSSFDLDITTHLEDEEHLVGAMMETPGLAALVASRLSAGDFLEASAPRVVFGSIQRLLAQGVEPSEVLVVGDLRKHGELEAAGGAANVMMLSQRTGCFRSNVDAFVGRVRENAKRRRLHRAAMRAVEHAANVQLDPDEVQAQLIAHLGRAARIGGLGETTLEAELGAMYDALAEDVPADVVRWDFEPLNRWVGPQRPGWVVVSGGWTSMGKSWMGLACAEAALRQGRRVLYVTLEMPPREIAERMASQVEGVELGVLQAGGWTRDGERAPDGMFEVVARRMNQLKACGAERMTILGGGVGMPQIGAVLAGARAQADPFRYVVVDTLNLLRVGRANSRREAIDVALQEAKELAVRFGVTFHLQAQLARSVEKVRRPPRLQDLKESGGIEQIGDVVLFVHRDELEDGSLSEVASVTVAKSRSGAVTGRIPAFWDAATYRFVPAPASHGLGGAA